MPPPSTVSTTSFTVPPAAWRIWRISWNEYSRNATLRPRLNGLLNGARTTGTCK